MKESPFKASRRHRGRRKDHREEKGSKEPVAPSFRRPNPRRKTWQIQTAKAQFSRLVNETVSSGYQTITKNGEPVAYMISKDEFDHYVKPKKSFLEAIRECPYPDADLDVERTDERMRDVDL